MVSSLNEELPQYTDTNQVTVTFKWNFGGNDVFVIGSFNEWKERIRMERRGGEYVLEKELERGITYEYKFVIDNEWRFAPDQPTKRDQHGNINNWIDTTHLPIIKKPSEEQKIADMYTQELCSDLTAVEPDPLPIHLHYVIANHNNLHDYRSKETVPYNSAIQLTNAQLAGEDKLPSNELPLPSHVILNHMGLRANDKVLGLTCTNRFKEKFVTTIYYKSLK